MELLTLIDMNLKVSCPLFDFRNYCKYTNLFKVLSIYAYMKRIELEIAIQRQSEKIARHGIISKCRDIARYLGEGGNTSKEWATAHYVFSDDSLKIDYQVYGMGDEEFAVDSEGVGVFCAKQRVNNPPVHSNPLMVEDDNRRFEVLLYHPGVWEQKIETLSHKTLDVPDEELAYEQQRLGITSKS